MCGISGYVGNNFNKYKFNILGLYNDTRGGDSCGIFVNNNADISVHYGHDKTKLYKNFVESGELKDVNLESPNFALLHCRKASVGGISLETAQPVVIRDANGEVVFSMIHNGTLINYRELADKYDVDFLLTETDSQIFCKTVFKAGYNVLSEYDGAGAFVFWDKRDGNSTIKLFKGASLFFQDDNNLYIERPLFAIKQKNSYWFSSIEESLSFINDNNGTIENIKSNVLFTIKNGNIVSEVPIDRSKRKQTEKLQVNWEKQRKLNVQPKIYNVYNHYDDYDGWPDYNNDSYYRNQNYKTPNYTKLDEIKAPLYSQKNKIIFDVDGFYRLGGVLCDGPIEATPAGFTDISTVQKKMYYFISGVLMKSYFDYLCAGQFVNQNFQACDEDCVEMYLSAWATHPVPWVLEDGKGATFFEFYSYNEVIRDTELFNGAFEPYFDFSRNRYIVKDGSITNRYEYSDKGSYYNMNLEQEALDKQILSGQISKNQVKKMIRRNLKETYARN